MNDNKIPETLEQAFSALDQLLLEEDKKVLKEFYNNYDELVYLTHSTLGRWIRNNWNFWAENKSQLYNDIVNNSNGEIYEPDGASSYIIRQYAKYLFEKSKQNMFNEAINRACDAKALEKSKQTGFKGIPPAPGAWIKTEDDI